MVVALQRGKKQKNRFWSFKWFMVMDRAGWLWRRKSSDKSPGGSDNLVSVSSHSEQCSDDQVQHHALILYHLHLFHFIWAVWLQLLPFTFSSMYSEFTIILKTLALFSVVGHWYFLGKMFPTTWVWSISNLTQESFILYKRNPNLSSTDPTFHPVVWFSHTLFSQV